MANRKQIASRKINAKKANAANMLFIEKDATTPEASPRKPKRKRSQSSKSPVIKKMPEVIETEDLGPDERVIDSAELMEMPCNVNTAVLNSGTVSNDAVVEEAALNEKINQLEASILKLKAENDKLHSLNMKLQEALLDKPGGDNFKELPGFPDKALLLNISQAAGESDYIFVKQLVLLLWPNGIGNATVSGRQSNNPSGKRKTPSREKTTPVETTPTTKLDPEKVAYIKDRLFERRILLRDAPGIAVKMAQKVAKYIAIATANNPALRTGS